MSQKPSPSRKQFFSLKKSEWKILFWCKETSLLECEGCLLGWAGTQSGSHQQVHSQVLYSKWVGNYQTMKLKKIYKYIYWIFKIYHWSYFLNAISAKNIFSDYTLQKTQIWQIWPCGMWIKPWQLLMVQKTFTFAFGTIYIYMFTVLGERPCFNTLFGEVCKSFWNLHTQVSP